MRRICTLAAFAAAALGISAGRAHAAHIDMPSAPAARETVAGAVTALSVVPGDGRADVIITLSGSVAVQDFTIDTPHRIVVDLSGATLARMERSYDRQSRGGITNIRMSQFKPDVVRIVLDLDAPHTYVVARTDQGIRVSITTSGRFTAWSSRRESPAVQAASLPNVAVQAAPPPTVAVRAAPPPTVAVQAAPPPTVAVKAPPVPNVERPMPAERPAPATNVATGTVAEPARDTRQASKPAVGTIDSLLDAATREQKSDSLRPVVVLAPPPVEVHALPLFTAAQSQQQRISVVWQDADIRDVIAGFATMSGRTIVVGKAVTGTVTAEIKDQPWDVAMKAVLEALGLAAIEQPSGIIVVDSYQNILEKQASEPLSTQMVSVNYVSAAGLVEVVKGLLSRDCAQAPAPSTGTSAPQSAPCIVRGTVASDSGTNMLLITEVTSRLPVLLSYVKQLDIRTPQVALKAKIISVNRTQIEQLGISYDLGSNASYFNTLLPRNRPGQEAVDDREGRITLGGDALAGVANAQRKFKNGSALNLLFSTALGKYSLTSFIDALREQDLSDIQAEPSVVTLDNRQARLLVGQETPVRVIDAGSAAQIGAPVRANVQFKETGIILTVTPHITNNRQIRMVIEAEQSSLNIIGGDLGFNIDKRNASTQLLVNDGETAVIGGLTQTQVIKNKSGIPLLSDLPLLGRLFSQTETREVKMDLLILITPHIIDEGEAVRPPSGSK